MSIDKGRYIYNSSAQTVEPFVKTSRARWDEKKLNLSALPPNKKSKYWGHIKKNHPDTALLLLSEEVREIISFFGAEVSIDSSLINDS